MLSGSMAFSSGARAWIVPEASKSIWSRQIDWYLNFVLAKSERHKSPELKSEFKQLLEEEGLPAPEIIHRPMMPVMVASENRLPVHHVIRVMKSDRPSDWIDSIIQIWTDMGRPLLRVFLPQGMTKDAFKERWNVSADQQIQLVLAETAQGQ